MKNICYECYDTGVIREKEIHEIAQFVTAKKYDVLYAEELPRFRKESQQIYALPYEDRPVRVYNGTDRNGLDLGDKQRRKLSSRQREMDKQFLEDFNRANVWMEQESTALEFLSLFQKAEDYELIWIRNSGCEHPIPDGYVFIGYDISYPCDYSGGFSMICDCMFLCRWHGCDAEGTLFLPEFRKLNTNGLFDDWQSAYDYMVKYHREDWTEWGEFCIFEIYKKPDQAE